MLLGDIALQPMEPSVTYYGGNNGPSVAESNIGNAKSSSNSSNNGPIKISPKRKDDPGYFVEPASNNSAGKVVSISPITQGEPVTPVVEEPRLSDELVDKILNQPIEPYTGYVQPDGTVKNKPYKEGDKEIEEAEAIDRIKAASAAEEERRLKEFGVKESGTTKEPVRLSENDDNTAFAASQMNTGINRTPEQVVMSSAGGGARNNRGTLANKAVFGGMSNSAHPGYSLFGGV